MDEAMRITSARHLHQVFWLPENELHDKLRVTYATSSNFSEKNLPVVLICAPMFGGRWMILRFNHIAVSNGIRVVCFDRPSTGGSTPVPLQHRMKVWLETVPALLKHLDVQYVHLLCHSAGTLYCLNTLYYLRDVLYPEHPYVAIMAPWVDSEQSKKTLMVLASKLPVGLVNSWHNVISFVATKVQPTVAWSGGVGSAVSGVFRSPTDSGESDSTMLAEKFGTSEAVAKELEKLATKYFFAEDARGGTEEAKMCLKMGGSDLWLICEDYKQYVQSVLKQEKEKSTTDGSHNKLKIKTFYAESDMMIGDGGRRYFEECWKQPDVGAHIDFESRTIPGTDHESVIADFYKSAVPNIFEEIKSFPPQGIPS